MADETQNTKERRPEQKEDSETKPRTQVIGRDTTERPPGNWQIGEDTPLTPERAAEGDRDKSDAV